MRTGPRAHTDWLCERARQRQACWLPRQGLHLGRRCWGSGEAEIYAALGMRPVPPEQRRPGCCEAGQFDIEEPPTFPPDRAVHPET
jgi:hypothetical protein